MSENKVVTCYKNDIEYIEDYFTLLDILSEKKELKEEGDEDSLEKIKSLEEKISQKKKIIDEKKAITDKSKKRFAIDKMAFRYHLNDIEKKIIIFLLYQYFSCETPGTSGRAILENVTDNRMEMMNSRHYLMENSKLVFNKLIYSHELGIDSTILDADFFLSEDVICFRQEIIQRFLFASV